MYSIKVFTLVILCISFYACSKDNAINSSSESLYDVYTLDIDCNNSDRYIQAPVDLFHDEVVSFFYEFDCEKKRTHRLDFSQHRDARIKYKEATDSQALNYLQYDLSSAYISEQWYIAYNDASEKSIMHKAFSLDSIIITNKLESISYNLEISKIDISAIEQSADSPNNTYSINIYNTVSVEAEESSIDDGMSLPSTTTTDLSGE